MRTDVDLSQLRGGSATVVAPGTADDPEQRKRDRANARRLAIQTWGPLVLTVVVALGLGLWFLLPVLQPVVPVSAVPMVVRVDTEAAAQTTAVQASGWIEPNPYPIEITPLVDGVVDHLPLVEGTPLVAGETVVAQLDTTLIDAKVDRARAELDSATSAAQEARTQLASAEARLKQNLEARLKTTRLEHELKELEQKLAMARARLQAAGIALRLNTANRLRVAQEQETLARLQGQHEQAMREAEALAEELIWLERDAKSAREMADKDAVSELRAIRAEADVKAARARLAGTRATVEQLAGQIRATQDALAAARDAASEPAELSRAKDEAQAEVDGLTATIAVHRVHYDVAQEAVDDPVDLRALRDNISALVAVRDNQRKAAQAALDELLVRRDLHTVVSPVDGEVLAVLANPGARVGPGSTHPAVITAFRPNELQVRVDLPFSDMPTIGEGQSVQVISDSAPGQHYDGTVSRLVREADIARNTLEVKVAINDADESLRPEMLVRCRFMPRPRPQVETDTDEPKVERYFVPSSAVVTGEGGSTIFVFDPRGQMTNEGRARRVSVEVVPATGTEPEGHVEVKGNLSRTFRVIEHPGALADGTRVKLPDYRAAPPPQPEPASD